MQAEKDLLAIEEVRSKVDKAYAAWLKYRAFSQQQVDAIVERVAAAGRAAARRLAEMAVEETGYGNVRDKHVKNLLAADALPRRMRGMKTVGVLRELPAEKLVEIGVPMGVVAAILPTTNPTSTAIYKILIALKSGNAIVLSPHPRAHQSTCYAAAMLYQAAVEAGAPPDIIQCIDNATIEATNALMRHERTAVILSTGGAGIVKAAYSSGKPAFGVGPGNVPALVDASADVDDAVAKVVAGKSFDFGTVCSSEQALVAEESLRARVMAALKANRAYLASDAQKESLGRLLLMPNWTVNPQCVGQSPQRIAQMAGFEVPPETSIICVEMNGVGKQHPLSAEKLSPVLALYFVKDFAAALDTCFALLQFGGKGHTAVIHATDEARIREYGMRMNAMRVLVNTSSPQGSTGITTNVFPSMTLGCGAAAGNITSDNVGPMHLINIKRIAYAVRQAQEAFETPLELEEPVGRTPWSAAGPLAGLRPEADGGVSRAPSTQAIAAAVDRYLAARQAKAPAPQAGPVAPSGFSCCTVPPAAAGSAPVPAAFVCEADVRAAIAAKQKIYIGPRTIVTPSARDLAGDLLTPVEGQG